MRKFIAICVLGLSMLCVALAVSPAKATSSGPGFLIDADFVKVDAESYECRAVVKDLETNLIVMQPKVKAQLDRTAIASADAENASGAVVRSRLQVSMASDAKSATISFDRHVNGEVLSSQQVVVRLSSAN